MRTFVANRSPLQSSALLLQQHWESGALCSTCTLKNIAVQKKGNNQASKLQTTTKATEQRSCNRPGWGKEDQQGGSRRCSLPWLRLYPPPSGYPQPWGQQLAPHHGISGQGRGPACCAPALSCLQPHGPCGVPEHGTARPWRGLILVGRADGGGKRVVQSKSGEDAFAVRSQLGWGGSPRFHGTARGSAKGWGGNSRHGEQRCGRSMPQFPNTASQEQLPLAQHSLVARHKQRDPKNPRQAEAEPWEGSQPRPGAALALLGPSSWANPVPCSR